jgi:tRNA A-37 threonylcarbamoyl transferase component Bud32
MSASYRVLRGQAWANVLCSAIGPASEDIGGWLSEHTQVLKQDEHSQVGLLQLAGELCYLKLYRPRSTLQQLRFRLGRGRAVQNFDSTAALLTAAVPVPEARACVLAPGGMLLLAQGIAQASDVHTLWQLGCPGEMQENILRQAAHALARLHQQGFAHGDCKWSNMLWAQEQLYLVDLDAVLAARAGSARQARDLARFTLNAEELALQSALYEKFLQEYLQLMSLSRQDLMRAMLPPLQKLRLRHQLRYGNRGQRLV